MQGWLAVVVGFPFQWCLADLDALLCREVAYWGSIMDCTGGGYKLPNNEIKIVFKINTFFGSHCLMALRPDGNGYNSWLSLPTRWWLQTFRGKN